MGGWCSLVHRPAMGKVNVVALPSARNAGRVGYFTPVDFLAYSPSLAPRISPWQNGQTALLRGQTLDLVGA